MPKINVRLFLGLLLAMLLSPQLFAHGLDVEVQRDGEYISGIVTYTDQTAGSQLPVEATDAQGTSVLANTETDSQGRFELRVAHDQPITLTIYGDEGHQVQTSMESVASQTIASDAPAGHHELMSQLLWPALLVGLAMLIGLARLLAGRKTASR